MAYKNALAGLDHGGGKAVIIGDPARIKTRPAAGLRPFRPVLSGRYVTACDVGTYVADMDVVATECDYVTGRSEAAGRGRGLLRPDGVRRLPGRCGPAPSTWGSRPCAGRTVGIAGVGKVGHLLAELALEDGARVVVADVDDDAVRRVLGDLPARSRPSASTDELVRAELDVYAPCALGHALTDAGRRRR